MDMNTASFENQIITTHSREASESFGEQLARTLPPGSVIAMHGDLGAGKTVIARGFARGLGISEAVSSPTYTIVQEYDIPDSDQRFYHLDLYRIADEHAALGFGVDEFLSDPDAWTLLEWPVRIEKILPPETLHLYIEKIDENTRQIQLKK
ncbi:MAG: tRNA (adenosine(37)-N6)-threonylcarbamoyltransferase complex ATPase subunit type 1 TsaE [Lentisphaerae bacterium]|nr:tRNA (adenosine(37)-N6)-threonylcarbamoyltransferase complex ATPase subunit type 1 TsaE [Lentisphaerota bacterium]